MEAPEITVAFDVDGTLIHQIGPREDTPRYEVIALFHILQKAGCNMIIWSGDGVGYAQRWMEKLGLEAKILEKGCGEPDITFDDEIVILGKVNIRI
jgi:hydroxymethylpyrimidine pyrophosphatase-like HAD family hydrolase